MSPFFRFQRRLDGKFGLVLDEGLQPALAKLQELGKEFIEAGKPYWEKYEAISAPFKVPYEEWENIKLKVIPPSLDTKEYDPPTRNFLQKLLFDWLQRANFAQAGVYREMMREFEPELASERVLVKADYPTANPDLIDMVAATRAQLKTGKGGPFPTSIPALMDLILRKDTDRAYSLWQGLTGQDKSTFMDISQEEGVPWMLGLILDIGLDPVTYLPFGLAFRSIKRGAAAIPALRRGAEAIKNTNFVRLLGKAFVPGFDLPKDYFLLESFMKRQGWSEEAAILARYKGLWRRVQGDKGQIAKLMTRIKQDPSRIHELSAANKKVFAEISEEIDSIGKELVRKKIIPFESYRRWKDSYMYVYYPEYTRHLSGRIPPAKWEVLQKPSFAYPKHFKSVDDALEFVRKLEGFKDATSMDEMLKIAQKFRAVPDEVSNLEKAISAIDDVGDAKTYIKALQASYTPEENFFKLALTYKTEASRLFRRDKFLQTVLDEFGQKIPNIFEPGVTPAGMRLYFPKGQLRFYPVGKRATELIDDITASVGAREDLVEVTPYLAKKLELLGKASTDQVGVTKKVAAYFLDENIARRLNRMTSAFFGDPATRGLIRYLNKWHSTWKGLATAIRLPFHLRNAYSNTFLLYVMDVDPHMIPVRYSQSIAIALGKEPTIKGVGGKILSVKQIREMAEKLGVIKTGWMGAERLPIWRQLGYFENYGRLKAGLNPLEWGRKFGQIIEDQARMALFIDRLAKGDNFRNAALRVFEGLYDYTPVGFTRFETNVMKRIMPFYSWFRHNTPHMIHALLEKPQKLANVGKVFRMFYNLAPETRLDRLLKPSYMDENMWLKAPDFVAKKMGRDEPVYYHFDLPYGELTPDMKRIVNLVNPMAMKPLFEAFLNIKTFPQVGMKVERFPGEMVPAPWFLGYAPETVQKVLQVEPYRDPKSGKVVLGMRARNRYLLYTMFPVLGEGSRLYPQPLPIEQERTPWRWLTYATGVGFMPLNVQQQKLYWEIQAKGRLNELKRILMQEQRGPTTEELLEILGRRK